MTGDVRGAGAGAGRAWAHPVAASERRSPWAEYLAINPQLDEGKMLLLLRAYVWLDTRLLDININSTYIMTYGSKFMISYKKSAAGYESPSLEEIWRNLQAWWMDWRLE